MVRGVGAARARVVLVATGAIWGAAALGGMMALAWYAHTPGELREPPARWPQDSALRPAPGRFVLVMLAHPLCPCTRASLDELETLMERVRGRVEAHVLFLHLEGVGEDWEGSALWRRAASIPGVTARRDEGGVEARRFGAITSGHVLLFDAEGRLRFNGGITGSRGHVGDNPGRATVEALLRQGEGQGQHPVYGCALEEPQELIAGGGGP